MTDVDKLLKEVHDKCELYQTIEGCLNQEPGLIAHFTTVQDDSDKEWPILFLLYKQNDALFTVEIDGTTLNVVHCPVWHPSNKNKEGTGFDLHDPACWTKIRTHVGDDKWRKSKAP